MKSKTNENTLKNRILIATMSNNWEKLADEYGVGVELDHYCQAHRMDPPHGGITMNDALKIVRKRDVRVLHGPFNELFPAAIDPKARELAMSRLRLTAEIAEKLGVHKMVVHSGYMPFTYFKDRSVEFWKEFMDGQPDNFEICIENVLDDEPYMLAEIAERVGDSRVGLCYDTGHANIRGKGGFAGNGRGETTDQDEWLKVLAPYLKHLHVHNNFGERDTHNDFAEGTVDIKRIIDTVAKKCPPETTITAELIDGEESFRWLKKEGLI